MKFLNTVQRNLDLYYEVKPGGKIMINFQGRNVNIHIMQAGIDLKQMDNYLKKKEFIENCDRLKKKYKNSLGENNKEKYIFFSLDGFFDINKIIIKLQAFDKFYSIYKRGIEIKVKENMEKIVEVNEENGNDTDINKVEEKTTSNEQNDTLSNNNNGTFAIIHRTDRLIEIIEEFRKNNIEPKRIQLIYPKENTESNMVLIEGRKNGNVGLKFLKPLIIHEENGEYRKEIIEMFHERRRNEINSGTR